MLTCIIIKGINPSIIFGKTKRWRHFTVYQGWNNVCNDLTTDSESFESLFIELTHLTTGHAKNVVIGVIYRPPNHDIREFIDHMSSITVTLTRDNKICYLMGDFNLDLFNHENHTLTGDFLNTLLSNSFLPLINRSTREQLWLIIFLLITSTEFKLQSKVCFYQTCQIIIPYFTWIL